MTIREIRGEVVMISYEDIDAIMEVLGRYWAIPIPRIPDPQLIEAR